MYCAKDQCVLVMTDDNSFDKILNIVRSIHVFTCVLTSSCVCQLNFKYKEPICNSSVQRTHM